MSTSTTERPRNRVTEIPTMSPTPLETAVYGLFSTQALHLADKHGVLSQLVQDGPATTKEIAAARGIDAETLDRLLVMLVAAGVLHVEPGGRWSIPHDAAPYLDERDPRYLGGFLRYLVTRTAGRMDQLDAYLARGKAAVDRVQPEPFEVLYRDPAATREFLAAMWSLSYAPSGELAAQAGLERAHHLVDVGGASGPFAVAALERYPQLRATVFDLPQVEPFLAENRERHGLVGRLGFVAGDFFRDALPPADCFAFGYILSDWSDDVCVELLRKAYQACADGGSVLVMERLFDDDRTGPLPTAAMNLSMHVETQGRHRTAAEYCGLLVATGFSEPEVRRSSMDKHLVLGRKTRGAS